MRKMELSLEGKGAIVTGAGQGIGKAIALALAEAGAAVLVAEINEKTGRATVQEIVQRGGTAKFAATDLRKTGDIESMVRTAAEGFERLDILVNNARPVLSKLDYVASLAEWDLALEVFLKAPALAAGFALPRFIEAGGGSIINIASVNAFYIAPHQPASYHVAKAGLVQLTRYLAVEFGKHHVTANAICPGIVDVSDRGAPLTADPVNKTIAETAVPIGRAATPQEIAAMTVFLASDAARYITGQALPVDGGETLMDHFHIAREAYRNARQEDHAGK